MSRYRFVGSANSRRYPHPSPKCSRPVDWTQRSSRRGSRVASSAKGGDSAADQRRTGQSGRSRRHQERHDQVACGERFVSPGRIQVDHSPKDQSDQKISRAATDFHQPKTTEAPRHVVSRNQLIEQIWKVLAKSSVRFTTQPRRQVGQGRHPIHPICGRRRQGALLLLRMPLSALPSIANCLYSHSAENIP